MSDKLGNVAPLILEGIEIRLVDDVVQFVGVISMRDPSGTVTPFLKQVHNAAVDAGAKELRVDLTKLSFMNSSSIRSLVDWVDWIRREPEAKRYVLRFITKVDVTWQVTTLTAIQSFGGEYVVVQRG